MPHSRLLLQCLIVVVFVIAGVSPSTASAAPPKYAWEIKEGAEPAKELAAGKREEVKAALTGTNVTIGYRENNTSVMVSCTNAKWKSETERIEIIGGVPGKMGTGTGGEALIFETCSVTEPATGCTVVGGTVATEKLKGELVSNPASEEAGWILLNAALPAFMTVSLEGAGCAARGSTLIYGELLAELNPSKGLTAALEFKLNSALREPLLSTGARVLTSPLYTAAPCRIILATVTGKFSAKLVSGAEFGFS